MGRGAGIFAASFCAGSAIALIHAEEERSGFLFSLMWIICLLSIFSSVILRKKRKKRRCKVSGYIHIILFLTAFFSLGISNVAVHTKPDHNNKRTEQNEPAFAYRLRNDLEKGMGRLVKDQRDLPVIKALTLGDKRGVDPGLKKAYGKAGAAHILALSGMHLGIIYMIVSSILGIIGYGYKSKIIKLVLTCIIIACYAFITGMSPSVVRAAIMIMLYKISKISGRKTGKWDMIALSAAIITAVEPHQMTEISFQLSFAAISGIAAFYKPISEAMKKMVSDRNIPFFLKKAVLYTWNTISISVSCQITTMPIAFYYFGTEPSRFLITNLTAIPIVTATLYSFASAALTFWIPGLGNISVMILRKLISTLNNMMEFLGS